MITHGTVMTMLGFRFRSIVGAARCKIFDLRHNVRTCGATKLETLTIAGPNAEHGAGYYPSHPKLLFESIGALNIDYEDYIFVDLGAGKGRVLLVASEFPFKQIFGVEFARELHQTACNNIRRYRSASQKCQEIRCLHQDAAEFVFPPRPTVVYMFNPFRPPVLLRVLQNLQESLAAHPRDVVLLYEAPFHGELIERETVFKCIATSRYHNAYRPVLSAQT